MIDRSKCSLNGVYRCENFAELARQNNFLRVPIGSAGGMDGWYLLLRVETDHLYPFISCDDKPAFVLRYFFSIIKKDGSSAFEVVHKCRIQAGFGPYGLYMNIQDIINEENGYLDDDEALTVEYGIHVDSILGDDGIWKFNFNDPFFCFKNNLTIRYVNPNSGLLKVLYGHEQLLHFHSSFYQNQMTEFISKRKEKWLIEQCLQIAHGVRILSYEKFVLISSIAHSNKLRNVVQYADQQLVAEYWCPEKESSNYMVFENCIDFELRHFLAHLVNHFKCLEDLKNIIQQLDIEKMPGEAIKTFAAKIFTRKF